MRPDSLLAFLVPRLVTQTENAVSDSLCYILTTYPQTSAALHEWLLQTGVDLPKPLEFGTQVGWAHGSRPDLFARHGQHHYLVLEAKFGAPLTPSQPAGYVECLPEDGAGILLFIAPEARREEIWETLARRCYRFRPSLGRRIEHADGLYSAQLCGRHALAITSWQALFPRLLSGLGPNDPARADLLQLNSLCNWLVTQGDDSSTDAVGVHDLDRRDRQLRTMVDALVAETTKAGLATTKGYRSTPGPSYYKRYMTLSGITNWCVENNSEYWARFGTTLIWLTIYIRDHPEKARCELLATKLGHMPILFNDYVLIPLVTTGSSSESEALSSMARQIKDVAALLSDIPAA